MTIQRNSGVSNVHMFSHFDFEGVNFYAAKQYDHFTNEGRVEEFFVSNKQEEDYEVLPVSELTSLEEQRVCGVEISDLPCLDSGHNWNLTSEEMCDLQHKVIAVDDENDPATKNIHSHKNIPFPQLDEENIWISEVIICLRQ